MLNKRQKEILEIIRNLGQISSASLKQELQEDISLVTVKRELKSLVDIGYIESVGAGRSSAYTITILGKLQNPLDARVYCEPPQDKRSKEILYNFDIFNFNKIQIYSGIDQSQLEEATKFYIKNKKNISPTIHKKELERFVIELSWKSSQIEGNTYTLLDTEILLKDGIESRKNTKEETIMILNHKKSFDFILKNLQYAKKPDLAFIEEIHKILVKGLDVNHGLRKSRVGITGSNYRPLDNIYQIKEAISSLCVLVNKLKNPYEKALLILAGISYIQPFEDGNKRTARLVTNAVLLAHGLAPLSYRNVDEVLYKEAMLTFYETNSIYSIKEIFVEQYIFSSNNYNGI